MLSRPAPPPRPGRRARAPTPGDCVLLILLVLAVPLSRGATRGAAATSLLQVHCDGAPDRRVDTRRDADLELAGPVGTTRVRIRGGQVWIAAAPCRNQLCRRMGRIDRPGRVLVCLPNRVLLAFAGGPRDVDAITR